MEDSVDCSSSNCRSRREDCSFPDGSTITTQAETISTTMTMTTNVSLAGFVVKQQQQQQCDKVENDRAIHRIHLSALRHNYSVVEEAAGRQQCSVITVVKADGYGHGAIETSLHLADYCGANAFAVATLEEGMALRQAFWKCPPGTPPHLITTQLSTNNHTTGGTTSSAGPVGSDSSSSGRSSPAIRRPAQIRILVLGPPVGYPRCFDTYRHYQIELMVSGPEVARALLDWVADGAERKIQEVETVATEWKEQLQLPPTTIHQKSAATLTNVSGQELAKEVRAILQKQPLLEPTTTNTTTEPPQQQKQPPTQSPQPYQGIQDAAKDSRARELAAAKVRMRHTGEDEEVDDHIVTVVENGGVIVQENHPSLTTTNTASTPIPPARKRLRWHALVDSGMGRLGFKSVADDDDDDDQATNDDDAATTHTHAAFSAANLWTSTTDHNKKWKEGPHRDVVSIIKQLYDAEIDGGAPIEFFGMCTHMAEANASSDYTVAQMARFKGLLKRVRQAGIAIPTISTDNSAALLTTSLTHFDSTQILRQPDANTRGFVRTGGAIYGQRPAFSQLKPISTLLASVRHVATIQPGESVGYDRAYIADHPVRIATLAIGFADGYPRELGKHQGKVSIRGQVFPVVGNVCMDMLMVELGSPHNIGVGPEICVGDVAILWGPDDITLDPNPDNTIRLQDFASKLQTTLSALTCGLNKNRVRREYIT